MGFLARPVYAAALEFRGLFPYERVLIAPLGHPLLREPVTSLEQIARYPLILQGTTVSHKGVCSNMPSGGENIQV